MLLMKNLEVQQTALVDLVTFARDHGELRVEHENVNEFMEVFAEAVNTPLPREDLLRLNILIQEVVILPVYTTAHAAAWLGITMDALRHAIWRTDPPLIETFKPGHDVLIVHDELVRYSRQRRYGKVNGQ